MARNKEGIIPKLPKKEDRTKITLEVFKMEEDSNHIDIIGYNEEGKQIFWTSVTDKKSERKGAEDKRWHPNLFKHLLEEIETS